MKKPEAFIKNIKCPYCGKLYAKQGYKNHIDAHEREFENSKFECGECDRRFPEERGLNIHRAKKHADLFMEPTLSGSVNGLEEPLLPSEVAGLTVDKTRPSLNRMEAMQFLLYSSFNTPAIGVRRELLQILRSEIDIEISLTQ